jgi:ABC-2 type transport system permease protein
MVSLYCRLIGARIRAPMQYKWSFFLELIGFGVITGLEFAVIIFLFARFSSVAGWGVAEVALLYGTVSTALGLSEMIARGFDAPFERMMQYGTFDTILIRPLGTFFQILASEFQLRRLGRTIQGLLVLSYALAQLTIDWTFTKVLVLPLAVVSSGFVFMGLFVIGATLCFWTVKTPEVINIFTFGGEFMAGYPVSIYNEWVRNVFLFVIPIALNYPAALFLLNRTDPYVPTWLAWLALPIALLFFSIAFGFWQIGVRRYTSTGS